MMKSIYLLVLLLLSVDYIFGIDIPSTQLPLIARLFIGEDSQQNEQLDSDLSISSYAVSDYQDQPITVVFSRPVIAIGEQWSEGGGKNRTYPFILECKGTDNIVRAVDGGHYRWVTTNIARFDLGVWPTDLYCTFQVDSTLTAHDGSQLKESIPPILKFATHKQQMSIDNVISVHSNKITNNLWRPFTSSFNEDGTPVTIAEIPPDAIIRLSFHAKVDSSLLQQELKIIKVEGSDGHYDDTTSPHIFNIIGKKYYKFELVNCSNYNFTDNYHAPFFSYVKSPRYGYHRETKQSEYHECIKIIDKLSVGTESPIKYQFKLFKGSIVSTNGGGPISNELFNTFTSLIPFNFPWIKDVQVSSNRQRLLLRHALNSSVTLHDLKEVISFVPYSSFSLELIDAVTLQINSKFKQSTSYKLIINPKLNKPILDGWGLPLLKQTFEFNTQVGSKYYRYYSESNNLLVPVQQNINQTFIITQNLNYYNEWEDNCSNQTSILSSVPISNKNLLTVLNSLANSYNYDTQVSDTQELLKQQLQTIQIEKDTNNYPKVYSLDTVKAWKDSNSYLEIHSYSCNFEQGGKSKKPIYQYQLVQQTKIGITLLSHHQTANSMLWVTDLDSHKNIYDVSVELYGSKDLSSKIELIEKQKTSKKGLVEFNNTLEYYARYFVVYSNGIFIYPAENYQYYGKELDLKFELITDRKLYAPGDSIFLKIYTKGNKNTFKEYKFQAQIFFSGNSLRGDPIDIEFDTIFQTANITFDIDENTPHGYAYISVVGEKIKSNSNYDSRYYLSTDLVISKPRFPIGKLLISTNQSVISPKDMTLFVNISTTSYLGLVQNNQTVYLEYSSGPNVLDGQNNLINGHLQITTDQNGNGMAMIELDRTKFNVGDSIIVNGYYIDSTNAYVRSSPSLGKYILDSKYTLKMEKVHFLQQYSWDNGDEPGIPIGVKVYMIDVSDNSYILDRNISVELVKKSTGESSLVCENIKTVNVEDSTTISPHNLCQYKVTDLGSYQLIAKSIDPNGLDITGSLDAGYIPPTTSLPSSYRQTPNIFDFSKHNWNIYRDRGNYTIQDTVSITYLNPFSNARALVRWGCIGEYYTHQYDVIQFGIHSLENTIKVPSSCAEKGATVELVLIGNSIESIQLPSGVIKSNLYVKQGPFSVVNSIGVPIIQRSTYELDITTNSTILEPGKSTIINIDLVSQDSKDQEASTELLVMVIDKRNLDLVPNPLSKGLTLTLVNPVESTITDSRKGMSLTYKREFEILFSRLKLDKWVNGGWLSYELSTPNQFYWKNIFQWLTSDSGTDGGYPRNVYEFSDFSGSPPPAASSAYMTKGGSTQAFASDQQQQQHQLTTKEKKFTQSKETILISKLVVLKGSRATLELNIPSDIDSTTYEIRAYTITSDTLEFKSKSTELIVRKPLNLLVSGPRFCRIGDIFELGVSIVVDSIGSNNSYSLKYIVLQDEKGKIQSQPQQKDTLELGQLKQTTTNIKFKFNAIEIGTVAVQFKLNSPSSLPQDIVYRFQVLPKMDQIYFGTSFVLTGNATSNEYVSLPVCERGTGKFYLTAGAGRYPMVQLFSSRILNLPQVPSSIDLISSQTVYGILLKYNTSSSPNSTSLLQQSKDSNQKTLNLINIYLGDNGEVYWYPPNSDSIRTPTNNYPYPTVYATVIKRLMDYYQLTGFSIGGYEEWKRFAKDSINVLCDRNATDPVLLSKFYLGYGESNIDLSSPYCNYAEIVSNFTKAHCKLDCQINLVLASIMNGVGDKLGHSKLIQSVKASIESQLRIQPRVAYVEASGTQSSRFSLTSLAVLLYLADKDGSPPMGDSGILDKMVFYLLQPPPPTPIIYDYRIYSDFISTEDLTLANLVTYLYDQRHHNLNPSINLKVELVNNTSTNNNKKSYYNNQLNSIIWAQHQFNDSNNNIYETNLDFYNDGKDGNDTSELQLKFSSRGKGGEISTAVGIQFSPKQVPKNPFYQGFYVEKSIQLVNGNLINSSSSSSPMEFKTGDLIKITLTITTPDQIALVDVIDFCSTPFEPLDEKIYGDLPQNSDRSDFVYRLIYPSPQLKETYPDKVIYHFVNMSPGTITLEYFASVTVKGEYTLPPTKVISINQPELFGLSKGQFIKVN